LVIYQEEYQQQSSGMIMEVTTAPREDLRTAHELANKTL
jgi:hypothetical protein